MTSTQVETVIVRNVERKGETVADNVLRNNFHSSTVVVRIQLTARCQHNHSRSQQLLILRTLVYGLCLSDTVLALSTGQREQAAYKLGRYRRASSEVTHSTAAEQYGSVCP